MSALLSRITFEGVDIPIFTIPKGTVLFHYQNENVSVAGNFFGEEIKESTYCLSPNRNTFFYPYPYIMDTNKYIWKDTVNEKDSNYTSMLICTTTTDVKVVLMLRPSPLVRDSKKVPNNFTISPPPNFVLSIISSNLSFSINSVTGIPETVVYLGNGTIVSP